MARRRYQKGSVIFSKSRQAWLGRYREDTIRPDGTVIRTRPQVVLGTKKELPTQRLAARKLDEILSRINDYAYQPTRISTIAEFAKRWREEVLAKRKPSTVCSANSHLNSQIIPQLGKLRLDQIGPENQQLFINQLTGASRKTVLNVLSTLSSMLTTAKGSAAPITLPAVLSAVLAEYKANWKPNPDGYLFVTRIGRPPSSNNVVEYQLWPILDALGIKRCGLHAFRHSVASFIVDAGYSIEVAQLQLRQSNARTTLGYTHFRGGVTEQAMTEGD